MAIQFSVLMKHLGFTAPLLLLAACGGGGGGGVSGGGALPSFINGVAVDGYLQGARVFLDIDRDGIQDSDEPSGQTDAAGAYSLNLGGRSLNDVADLPVVAQGGIDSDTGFTFGGQLVTRVDPAAARQVLTPLTTMAHEQMEQGLAANMDEARNNVASALGLAGGGAALQLDPIQAASSDPELYGKQLALQRAVEALATAETSGTDRGHEAQERIAKALAKSIRELARAGQSVADIGALVSQFSTNDLTNSAAVNQAKAQVATLAGKIEAGSRTALGGTSLQGLTGTNLVKALQNSVGKVLVPLDQLKVKVEREIETHSDNPRSLSDLADETENEHGDRGLRDLIAAGSDNVTHAAVNKLIAFNTATTPVAVSQPSDTTGRLLASNCFQCHGTMGVGGFDRIRGDAGEVSEYLTRNARSNIMAAHAQGYTPSQLAAIVAYLNKN